MLLCRLLRLLLRCVQPRGIALRPQQHLSIVSEFGVVTSIVHGSV
jgi:hypothetical protein